MRNLYRLLTDFNIKEKYRIIWGQGQAEMHNQPLEWGRESSREVRVPDPTTSIKYTGGFATTHVVVSVRHPNTYKSPYHPPTSQIQLTARIASINAIFRTTIHAIFLLTARRIRFFFSLKPSPSQGESSLKILARLGSPFRRSYGTSKQTNSLTNSLTDWYFNREI